MMPWGSPAPISLSPPLFVSPSLCLSPSLPSSPGGSGEIHNSNTTIYNNGYLSQCSDSCPFKTNPRGMSLKQLLTTIVHSPYYIAQVLWLNK